MEDALPTHKVWSCGVPSEAMVSDWHALLFAVPPGCRVDLLEGILGSGSYVADGALWIDMIVEAAGDDR